MIHLSRIETRMNRFGPRTAVSETISRSYSLIVQAAHHLRIRKNSLRAELSPREAVRYSRFT
jgi:hypothetical protein